MMILFASSEMMPINLNNKRENVCVHGCKEAILYTYVHTITIVMELRKREMVH